VDKAAAPELTVHAAPTISLNEIGAPVVMVTVGWKDNEQAW